MPGKNSWAEALPSHLEGAKENSEKKTRVQQLPLQNDHHLAGSQRQKGENTR